MDEARRDVLRQRDEAGRPNSPARPRADQLPCANCGGSLPENPPRRHVPRRGGRFLPVCHACSNSIDEQTVLLARGVAQVDRAVDHYEARIGKQTRRDIDLRALFREIAA